MLSKKICKICHKKFYGNDKRYAPTGWKKPDENRWKVGKVYCTLANCIEDVIEEDKIIFIKDDPPEHCKYTLEHVISDQDI